MSCDNVLHTRYQALDYWNDVCACEMLTLVGPKFD